MPTLQVRLPRPHAGQRKILRERKRFNVVDCGRRWGKTVLGVNVAVPAALEGYPVGWFAPSYKYVVEAWRDFLRILKPVTLRSDKTEKRIELIGGGVVEFWSLKDPDAGRSRKYKVAVVDEAAKVVNLGKCWNEAIRPTLADFRGDGWFLSTPKGKDGFWELWTKGQDRLEPQWASWKMPTSTNPFIHPDEIIDLKRSLPERVYIQEIEAEFHDDGGGVFRNVKKCVDTGRTQAEAAKAGMAYSQGSDLARTQDFSVNSVLNAKGRQVFLDRYQQMGWSRQLDLVAQTSVRYLNAPVTFDATAMGGDLVHEALRSKRMGPLKPYVYSNQSKEALMDNLALLFEQEKVSLMDVPEQTAELLAFEYEILPSRKVRMQAPEGMHDDIVNALALSAWGMGNTRKLGFL